MSTWDKLSMADRAKYIKLAVQNGVTSLGDIREVYNKYSEGGPKSKGEFVPLSEVATYDWDNNTVIKDPSGNKKKFADVLRVDPSYKVLVDSDTGKLITEEYLLSDDHKASQDVLERQISNTTRGSRGLDVYQGQSKAREEFKQALNNAGVFSDLRTKNYQNALRRNPNFGNDWNMFNNIMEFTNIATGGAANRLSLTQNARLLYDIGDAIFGDGSWDTVGNSILGNNGIVSDKFAAEHPYWTMAINGVGDITGGVATYKTYNTLSNPRSSYNIRRGMSLKKDKDLNYALRDLHDYNVRKQMQGIDATELYGLDYADELGNSGLIDSYAGRPTIRGNNKYYIRTSAPGNQISTGVKDVVDNRLVNQDRPVFLSAGEPWLEFSNANTIHEFPLEAFGRRSSVDWNGVPTGVDVFDVYNGYTGPNPRYIQGVSHPMAFQISPRSAYTGFQTTVPAEDYVRGFMNIPHTTYERRMLGDIPYVQKTEYTPNGRKPYINSSGIPMKEPPTAEFHKVTKEEVLNALTDTFYKRNGGKLNSNKYGDGSWIQSIMDGTLWDEWKSARANKEVVQGQPTPGNPIVSNKNLNKTEGKSSKETFSYNGNTVYRDLDNNYYDAKGNKLADPENDLLYTYHKQLRDSLKSGTDPLRYFRYYTDNYRHLQKSRIKAAKAASFIDPLNERIPISQGKSKGVSAPKVLIDSMIAHKPANADIYLGLGMLSQETDFYNKRNHGFAGNSLGATNNERYVLPDQTFHRALSYAIRKQYKDTKKREGLTQENYVKKYLNEDNISKNKEVLNYVNKILAEDLNSYQRFKGYIQEDLKPAPNFWDHTWNELLSGNYNPGDKDYNNKVNKEANALKRDPKLSEYVRKALKSSKSK